MTIKKIKHPNKVTLPTGKMVKPRHPSGQFARQTAGGRDIYDPARKNGHDDERHHRPSPWSTLLS
jgi:hypothetical protein